MKCPHLDKIIYNVSIASFTFNGEFECISSKMRNNTKISLLLPLFNTVLKVLDNEVWQKMKDILE